MLTVIWGGDDFYVIDLMNSQRSFNSEYFVNHILAPMVAKVFPRGRIPHTRRLQLHLENYRVHFSKDTEQFITENHIGHVPHPPYSPNLAPSDFWLFGHVKTSLVCQTFDDPEQLLEAITEFLNEIQPPEVAVFSHWVERVRWVLEDTRDYHYDQIHLLGKHFLIHPPEPGEEQSRPRRAATIIQKDILGKGGNRRPCKTLHRK
jgi:histone-lysine N-methyltransferase SETMAR